LPSTRFYPSVDLESREKIEYNKRKMKFNRNISFYPQNASELEKNLEKVTHLGIGAHQDDLEIMSFHGINECYARDDRWFGGIICTNGSGTFDKDRGDEGSDSNRIKLREKEQECAARIGHYGFVAQMGYSSEELKRNETESFINDLFQLLSMINPRVIYTHNPADKHITHVAVLVNVIKVIRELPEENQPGIIYGCEAWRDLDWLSDLDKVILDVTDRNNLALPLLEVFNSQIKGGKRYDLATIGRRLSNATFFNPHEKDRNEQIWYAMDLTPLIRDYKIDIIDYVSEYIEGFKQEIFNNLKRFL
jgi:LmbE family N-acetylglucosaminyl deacetylase